MRGFDPKFADLPSYILGITKEIWEDRGIETLNRYYTPDIAVRSPSGVVVGNQAVIGATMSTLAEFPDRTLFGEDVIWSGDETDGFLSSHRILSTATHLGDGRYGPASGSTFRYRIIADCAVRENQVYDEWLIRDQGAIVRQLGLDPQQYAADEIEREGGPDQADRPFAGQFEASDGYTGSGNDHAQGHRYAELMGRIVDGDLNTIRSDYDRAVQVELPGGHTGHGRAEIDHFWLGLRSAFPGAAFQVHHRIGREDPGLSPRAAVRWSLTGVHDGWGAYGPPTGAPVHIMGISHAEFGPWGLRREWILIDEIAIWKQILLHRG